jgi:hypothetical protein
MSGYCGTIHGLFNKLLLFEVPFDEQLIPLNGIYVLFEKGEEAHGGQRIVRIGTHTGNNQLRLRLKQHFIKENKDRSIFRKNIGRALLSKNSDPFIKDWDIDLTSTKSKQENQHLKDSNKLVEVEGSVTRYIQHNFRFVVLQISDREMRLFIESKLISTVSLCSDCKPTARWLGLYSSKEKIREIGLWQVNELCKEPLKFDELRVLESLIHH